MRIAQLGIALLVALPNVIAAQSSAGSALAAARRGLALIDSAIAANGGVARLRAVDDIGIRYRGRRWMTWQSEKAGPPWNVQPTVVDMVVDFKNNRLMRYGVTRYPADFAFVSTQMVTGPNGLFFASEVKN